MPSKKKKPERALLDWRVPITEDWLRGILEDEGVFPEQTPASAETLQAISEFSSTLWLIQRDCLTNQAFADLTAAQRKVIKTFNVATKALTDLGSVFEKQLDILAKWPDNPNVPVIRGRLVDVAHAQSSLDNLTRLGALSQSRNKDQWEEHARLLDKELDRILRLAGTSNYDGGVSDNGPIASILGAVIPFVTGEKPARVTIARKIRKLRHEQIAPGAICSPTSDQM